MYIAIDGDDVGSRLEHLIITNSVESLEELSGKLHSAFRWLCSLFTNSYTGRLIFFGGDNLLVEVCASTIDKHGLAEISKEFFRKTGFTLSIGVGPSPQKAYFALKYVKTGGKNSIRYFDELVDL